MKSVNLGIVSPVPQGEWNATTTYPKLSIVRTSGGSYIARSQNRNIEPGVDESWQTYWMALNFDGSTGQQGEAGPAGEGVPTGGLSGQVLAKSSNNNYETEWVPQSQIAAGSATNDGNGNNITNTYETKSDAATKNTNLQQQITQNANNITQNAQNITQNAQLISRNEKRLDGLEQRIKPSPFVTDSMVAYQKVVPSAAVGAAEIQILGGMTYKTTNLIKTPYVDSSKTENGITWTVNSDGSVSARGTSPAGSTFVLCNGVSFGSSDVNALTSNVTSGSYAFGNCAYNGTTQTVYLSVGVGETVSKTFYPIINIGASVAPYEPYFAGLRDSKVTEVKSVGVTLPEQSFTISTAVQALEGNGWGVNKDNNNHISWDEFGNVKWNVMVRRQVFTGTENIRIESGAFVMYGIYAVASGGTINCVCNHYKPSTRWDVQETDKYNIILCANQNAIRWLDSDITTVDDMKAKLSAWYADGDPLTVDYIIATPVVTDISNLITLDNFIEVEGGGTLTFENAYGYAVPSTVEYITAEATA